ncbi:MAG: hypothetical protein KIT09_31655 [Bryobacteraceae bacterium]|nr:hypothetical protein [Bryobacteraceae bacterium]
MPVGRRVLWIAAFTAGFAVVLAAAVTAVFVVPDLRAIPHRVAVGLAAIAACVSGILLIARSASRLEASSKPAPDLHIPGLDAEVPGRH